MPLKIEPINKNLATGQAIWVSKGPIIGRNWYSSVNPTYTINQEQYTDTGNTGIISLQGTNQVALTGAYGNGEIDLLPTPGASWSTIATGNGNLSGSFNTSYMFLQIIVSTPGTGYVMSAWCYWN
jgi:hypothetical protein